MENITAKVGEIFKVVLEENPASTGFSWAVNHMPDDVDLLDTVYYPDTRGLIGAKGKREFIFGAMNPCNDKLKFDLIQPWDLPKIGDSEKCNLIITK
jgi:predicted secreted protein